jgi:hypothetical protein
LELDTQSLALDGVPSAAQRVSAGQSGGKKYVVAL